jgi:type VI secretion system protein ImpE
MGDAAAEFRAGDLAACLSSAQAAVRSKPSDAPARVFLAQLLMVLGQWERALQQLKVVEELDASTLPFVRTYQTAVQCERLREDVIAGRRAPLVMGEPGRWLAKLLQANQLLANGECAAASQLGEQAFAEAPGSPGVLNGERFEWIADMDSRLGPTLEMFVNGKYYWVPVQQIQALKIEAPADVRDLVWLPAEVTWVTGGETVALLPARYPGTERESDPQVALGRRTEWKEVADGTFVGIGQKVLATDVSETALLEFRDLRLDAVA